MQHFTDAHHLEDAQAIADVAAYISHLPANHSLGEGSGVSIEHGKQLYAGACASCHGVSAEGDASNGYPRLAGQHYLYLLRVFFETPDEEWGDFSSTHGSLLNNLQRSDKTALADYLSRLDR
jgi:cytochrome c553